MKTAQSQSGFFDNVSAYFDQAASTPSLASSRKNVPMPTALTED